MGNDQTTLRHKDINRLQMSKFLQISAQHNKKVYNQNVKPFKQFLSIIKTIHVRSTYLKYQWALKLCQQFTKNPQKLYQQYCQSYKLSLMKKSQCVKFFQPKSLSQNFQCSFQKTTNELLTINFLGTNLENVFQEVKCYFMVLNWFLELPLNNFTQHNKATSNYPQSSKQNINTEELPQYSSLKKVSFSEIDNRRQKIYNVLLKLTEKYFDNYYFEKELRTENKQSQSPKLNPIRKFNSNQINLIKLIARESSFRQRQIYIACLLDLFFQKYQNSNQKEQLSFAVQNKIKSLVQILGLKNVYCVLRIVNQVGQIQQIQQVSVVFNFIILNIIIKNQQKDNFANNFKVSKSPQKKPKSNKKIRTQSIR